MARTNNLTNFLTDVAAAIKEKKGDNTNIQASSFDTEILSLPSQGTYEERTVNVTENGTQVITPSQDYDAMDQVTINTAIPLQSKSYSFTENQNMTLLPDTGYTGFSQVNVAVDVEGTYTTDATATRDDILSGKMAYAKGKRVFGNIQTVVDPSAADNFTQEELSNDFSTWTPNIYVQSGGAGIVDICETFNLCLIYQNSTLSLYNFENYEPATKILDIPATAYNSMTYRSAKISNQLNEIGNLNIFITASTTGSNRVVSVVQYNLEDEEIKFTGKISQSATAGDANIAVNPINPDVCAAVTLNNSGKSVVGFVYVYNPVSNVITKVIEKSGSVSTTQSWWAFCDWDCTGKVVLFTTAATEQGHVLIIEILDKFFTSYSTKLDIAYQDTHIYAPYNDEYYIRGNALISMEDGSVVTTYNEYTDFARGKGYIWTNSNRIFVYDTDNTVYKCFKINADLTLTQEFSMTFASLYNYISDKSNRVVYIIGSTSYRSKLNSETYRKAEIYNSVLYNTSDTTANPGDVFYPKTAYINNQKVVGEITPTYGQTVPIPMANKIEFSTSYTIYDIAYPSNIAVLKNGTNGIYITKIVNNQIQYTNMKTYTKANLGISYDTYDAKFGTTIIDKEYNSLTIWVLGYQTGINTGYNIARLEFDVDTLNEISHKVYSATMGGGRDTKYKLLPRPSNDIDVALLAGAMGANGGIYSTLGVRSLRYSKTGNSFTLKINQAIQSTTSSTVAVLYGCYWSTDGQYLYGESNNNTEVIYSVDANHGWTRVYYVSNNTSIPRRKLLGNGLTLTNQVVGDINGNALGTSVVNFGNMGTIRCLNNLIFYQNETTTYVYEITEANNIISVNTITTNSTIWVMDKQFGYFYDSGENKLSGYASDREPFVKKFTRYNYDYINIMDANATTSDVLINKVFYNNSGKQIGIMPNNGALSYTPSDTQQAIPAGYTSGGTISAADITTLSSYNTCLGITEDILNTASMWYRNVRYIKWKITAIKPNSTTLQASEFGFSDSTVISNETRFSYPNNTVVTSNQSATASGEEVTKLIDNSVDTKFCKSNVSLPCIVTIDLGENQKIDLTHYKYYYYYTANDDPTKRDPISWELSVSEDDITYHVIDTKSNLTITEDRKALAGVWQVDISDT